jgi:hypothetical protein
MTRVRTMLPGAAVGALLGLLALPLGFISGTGRFWERPENDYNAYLVAWQYFLHDRWRFPLFDLPQMGYPEGGSALFNDALPIGILPSKLLYTVTGLQVNPFGWWILLTYVLLGGFGSRLVHSAGARLPIAVLVGAFLTVGKVLFTWRLGHVAISSHFVIVWALTLYVENVRDRKFTFPEHLVLAVATLLINAYLLVMVAAIQSATVLTLLVRRQLAKSDMVRAGVIAGMVVVVAFAAGYGAMFKPGPATMRAGGFGHFSWNLATLLMPMNGFWGPSLVVRDATGGQYEGDGYLGGGVVLLGVALLVARPRQVAMAARRHWPLTLAILACMLFAASNRIYWGSHLLATIPLPERVLDAAALFRASGRFIWVAVYAVTAFSTVAWARWLPAEIAAVGLVLAASVNAAEMRIALPSVTASISVHPPDLIDGDQMTAWLLAHERLFQFPSNSCGALVVNTQWASKEANRELRVQLLAARLGRPSNSIYTSRPLKDCLTESRFSNLPALEPGTLYMVTHEPERLTPALSQLVTSGACLDAGYAFICSRQRLEIDSAVRHRSLTLQPSLPGACPGAAPPPVTATWQAGEPVELRVGSPDGTVAGSGPAGSAQVVVPAGTVLYLMPQDRSHVDAVDVEAVYYAPAGCASGGGRP